MAAATAANNMEDVWFLGIGSAWSRHLAPVVGDMLIMLQPSGSVDDERRGPGHQVVNRGRCEFLVAEEVHLRFCDFDLDCRRFSEAGEEAEQARPQLRIGLLVRLEGGGAFRGDRGRPVRFVRDQGPDAVPGLGVGVQHVRPLVVVVVEQVHDGLAVGA